MVGKHKYPQSSIRIDPELMVKLRYIANENGRSGTKEIEQLIIRHIKEYEQDYGEIKSKDVSKLYN